MEKTINREHKDRLFAFIFGREEHKAWTLDLYNAINDSAHTDVEDIELNTIEDVLYMGMRNDVSFILKSVMSLYEQQSTYPTNMPVRDLMYVGKLYDKYIHDNELNVYGEKQIRLPMPRLVTFYNGARDVDDCELKLSDAFDEGLDADSADVAVRVHLKNINRGHNKELLTKCRPLYEYSWLMDEIRDNRAKMPIEEAVDKAIDDMPKDFLIRSYLIGNRAEVKDMCLTEYDEAKTMQMFKEEGREEGRAEGRAEGRTEGMTLLADAIKRIKSGETKESLIEAGMDEKMVSIALSCI